MKVVSRRGSIHAFARVTEQCRKGMVFIDFHFSESPVDELTSPACDPICKVPEIKAAVVRIEKTF